jgi:hypothetical protein
MRLFDRKDVVLELVTNKKYGLTPLEAEDLVKRAEEGASGMACHELGEYMCDVWVTHMTTQDGKFIIELE